MNQAQSPVENLGSPLNQSSPVYVGLAQETLANVSNSPVDVLSNNSDFISPIGVQTEN